MNKYFEFVGIELRSMFGVNKLLHEKGKKGKLVGYSILMLYVVSVLLFMSLLYSFTLAKSLQPMNALHLLPATMMAGSCVMTLITTICRASSTLFIYSDYDVVMSLPVKTTTVIASRMTVLYLLNIGFIALLLIPAYGMYTFFAGFSLLTCVFFFVAFLFVPLVPIVIATVIGMGISIFTARFRLANILNFIGLFLVLIASFGFSFLLSSSHGELSPETVNDLAAVMSNQVFRLYPLTEMFTNGVCHGDLLSLFSFLGISAGVFALFIFLVSLKYKAICTLLVSKRTLRKYKLTELKGESVFKALYRKELKRYFSSPIYVFNTGFGVIMLVIAAVACVVTDVRKIPEIGTLITQLSPVLPMAISVLVGTVCTTACAISLEGKSFWILTTAPVSAATVYYSKIAVNLSVTVPTIIFSDILLIIGLRPDPITAIWMFVIPILFSVLTAEFGLWLNMRLPNYEWKNDTQVVKQSMPVLLGMLIPMFAGIAMTALALMNPSPLVPIGTSVLLIGLTLGINYFIQKTPLVSLQ